jgi:hypothetical protein
MALIFGNSAGWQARGLEKVLGVRYTMGPYFAARVKIVLERTTRFIL